jgi:RES domain-containing protein
VRLWRALPLVPELEGPDEEGGPLCFPRPQQGGGRHDNPGLYGCLYLAEEPVSALAEMLAPFRGSGRLLPSMLVRYGDPLGLAELRLEDDLPTLDLDRPSTLIATGLRPSQVATRSRSLSQCQAATLYQAHPTAVAIRWSSTFESTWINWTLFERAAPDLRLEAVRELGAEDPLVLAAAAALGLFP